MQVLCSSEEPCRSPQVMLNSLIEILQSVSEEHSLPEVFKRHTEASKVKQAKALLKNSTGLLELSKS